ncbi:hypothetical protein [Streptomyces bungoensis]|uniref:hypothetical protein n=1 Tax=Streptomyces bungoensis TaxID=285568 RepID=UPI000A481C87|nr:hypothetical protein [Streptomyces bungoensis]
MSRLSFEKKRAQQPAAHPAVVHVRVSGAGSASVGGTAVTAAPGQEIQQAVLDHLQRLAISLGAPIRATIHDDRVGCVVPLEVSADGSSRVAGEPARVAPRAAPGVVQAPTGQFGPAPVMDLPSPRTAVPAVPAPATARDREAAAPAPAPLPDPESTPAAASTPARGFDAVAEEVLGDEPVTETAEGAELLAEPMRRINAAVRDGRIEEAAGLADRTVAEASAVLGPRHAEVLHLRELTAYIAYLAGDPVRACGLSLDLARLRRQALDAESAYGNVQSAATAWRAVRDPEEGLRLGRDLIALWADLAAEPGPAAGDPRPLESARARMVRLTDRAAKAARA